MSQLEPFQELPQLLDPHLQRLVPVLSDALLESLTLPPKQLKGGASRNLLISSSKAICKLLYTFTKIRGEKVIVRFFGAETKHLELLLSAVEKAENDTAAIFAAKEATRKQEQVEQLRETLADEGWSWEERYVCLLWLSHLLLAPFDLATISSTGAIVAKLEEPGLKIPPNVPGVTLRVLPLAFKYLGSAGKERDAAKALLVRLSMRRDMQELGLLHNLVHWAMHCLKTSSKTGVSASYYYIGILSYLAGILNSSLSTADMDTYLLQIFRTVQNISDAENIAFQTVHTSATARKTVIKVLRTICVLVLRTEYIAKGNAILTNEIVETTIGHLLDALADNDTPVRLAASKALSVITFKLDADEASQVVDAVLESLEQNVLYDKQTGVQDLSAVNPLEWHGLMLTLSHLLYRKSPPISSLASILRLLLTGLTFEQRSTSGSSIGTNVRDASCFGVWATARRYTTKELKTVKLGEEHDGEVIQYLATNLVCAASLDPAGNIRRGASAALQELIGRHPDVVKEGISVVQVVDYHAVALRSRAMTEVALGASKLGTVYGDALTTALLGWRGVGEGDASCRRTAAKALGMLEEESGKREYSQPWQQVINTFEMVKGQLDKLKPRENDKRHGLILCLASLTSAFQSHLGGGTTQPGDEEKAMQEVIAAELLPAIIERLKLAISARSSRKPEPLFEASCRLIQESVGLLYMLDIIETIKVDTTTLKDVPGFSPNTNLSHLKLRDEFISIAKSVLDEALKLAGTEVLDAAVSAARAIIEYTHHEKSGTYRRSAGIAIHQNWAEQVKLFKHGLAKQPGFLLALANIAQHEHVALFATQAILEQWAKAKTIEDRIICLKALHEPEMSLLTEGFGRFGPIDGHAQARKFVTLVSEGMDDYTCDSRGDVGSLVRIESLKCAYKLFREVRERYLIEEAGKDWYRVEEGKQYGLLFGKVLRLAAEKLDKVRTEAQKTLSVMATERNEAWVEEMKKPWGDEYFDSLQESKLMTLDSASKEYFKYLLECQTTPLASWLLSSTDYSAPYDHTAHTIDLLTGLVSSADTGSESLVRASRLALDEFCRDLSSGEHEDRNTQMVMINLLQLIRQNAGNDNDKILIPALETLGFLFDAGVAQHQSTPYRTVYLLIQKSHYKSGSVRKLETCVKIYGYLMEYLLIKGARWVEDENGELEAMIGERRVKVKVTWDQEDVDKVTEKVTGMLIHPFVSVRGAVADVVHMERGGLAGMKGKDWGKATKADVIEARRKIRDRGM